MYSFLGLFGASEKSFLFVGDLVDFRISLYIRFRFLEDFKMAE